MMDLDEVCSACEYRKLCDVGYWDAPDGCPLRWEDLLPWEEGQLGQFL